MGAKIASIGCLQFTVEVTSVKFRYPMCFSQKLAIAVLHCDLSIGAQPILD